MGYRPYVLWTRVSNSVAVEVEIDEGGVREEVAVPGSTMVERSRVEEDGSRRTVSATFWEKASTAPPEMERRAARTLAFWRSIMMMMMMNSFAFM